MPLEQSTVWSDNLIANQLQVPLSFNLQCPGVYGDGDTKSTEYLGPPGMVMAYGTEPVAGELELVIGPYNSEFPIQ